MKKITNLVSLQLTVTNQSLFNYKKITYSPAKIRNQATRPTKHKQRHNKSASF